MMRIHDQTNPSRRSGSPIIPSLKSHGFPVFGAMLLLGATAMAQMPAGGGRGMERIAREGMGQNALERGMIVMNLLNDQEIREQIGITDEQAATLRAALTELQQKEVTLNTDARNAATRHTELLADYASTEDDLIASAEALGALRTDIVKLGVQRVLAVRDTLGPEQTEALIEVIQERTAARRDAMTERVRDARERGGARDRQPQSQRPPRGQRER